jgi:hypothetical protein
MKPARGEMAGRETAEYRLLTAFFKRRSVASP